MKKRIRISALVLLYGLAAGIPAATSSAAAADTAGNLKFATETREYLGRLEKLGFSGVVLVAGEVTRRHDADTGVRSGRLVRGSAA